MINEKGSSRKSVNFCFLVEDKSRQYGAKLFNQEMARLVCPLSEFRVYAAAS